MDILNAEVKHKQYGSGCVVEQTGETITVKFGETYGLKRFLYPSIFENYLTLCSDELQKKQLEELRRQREESEAAMLRRTEEDEKRKAAMRTPQKPARKSAGKRTPSGTSKRRAAPEKE